VRKLVSVLHQFKFTIWWHKTHSLLCVKPRQIHTLMEGNIIELNCFATARSSIAKEIVRQKSKDSVLHNPALHKFMSNLSKFVQGKNACSMS